MKSIKIKDKSTEAQDISYSFEKLTITQLVERMSKLGDKEKEYAKLIIAIYRRAQKHIANAEDFEAVVAQGLLMSDREWYRVKVCEAYRRKSDKQLAKAQKLEKKIQSDIMANLEMELA